MTESFVFAHLSDPHLSDLSQVRVNQLLGKRALGYLSWRRKRRFEHRSEVLSAVGADLQRLAPDHTVVTGDLTHISLPHEFEQALRWLESLGSHHRVTVIPGNHDAYVEVPWRVGCGQWEDYLQGDDGGQGPDLFPSIRHRGPVAFIGCNSALPVGPLFAKGTLGHHQRERLQRAIEALDSQHRIRVLLIHHPPVPGEEKWRKRLTDAPALCAMLRETPVDLVLHGHRHRALASAIPGTSIPVFGIPSSSAAGVHSPLPAEYNVYRIQCDLTSWRISVCGRAMQSEGSPFSERQIDVVEGVFN